MTPEMRSSLAAALRWQLTAVEQHFIHVLILKPRGAQDAVDAIMRVDEIDLANSMRLVEYFVSQGVVPVLHAPGSDATHRAPRPGGDLSAALQAERRLEAGLGPALQAARDAVASGPDRAALPWLLESLEARTRHANWLAHAAGAEAIDAPASELPSDAMAAANALFLQLLIVIEQGLVHAFVQRSAGRHDAADAAWMLSAAGMKYATSMTTVMGRLRLAPRPGDSAPSPALLRPQIRLTPADAAARDRALAARCAGLSDRAADTLSATDLGGVARKCGALFAKLADPEVFAAGGRAKALGETLPCVAFDRVVETFVWPRDRLACGG